MSSCDRRVRSHARMDMERRHYSSVGCRRYDRLARKRTVWTLFGWVPDTYLLGLPQLGVTGMINAALSQEAQRKDKKEYVVLEHDFVPNCSILDKQDMRLLSQDVQSRNCELAFMSSNESKDSPSSCGILRPCS